MELQNRDINIKIGDAIRAKLEEKGMTVVSLANSLKCSRAYVYRILSKSSIDTETLSRISKALNYDFFAVFSRKLSEK